MVKTLNAKVKRGDTVIEVMFAFAVFALVAILSIAMMNSGVATSERSLELVVARNELNAQAEALRFIHSSYVSELTLPECKPDSKDEKCQQFDELWKTIVNNAVSSQEYNEKMPTPVESCNGDINYKDDVYRENNAILNSVNAFVLNVRKLGTIQIGKKIDSSDIYINSKATQQASLVFQPAPLGARLVYSKGKNSLAGTDEDIISTQQGNDPTLYTNLIRAEGVWVVAVKSNMSGSNNDPQYYDFRIQTCWYGSGNAAPTTLDTIIRLNNPEILK